MHQMFILKMKSYFNWCEYFPRAIKVLSVKFLQLAIINASSKEQCSAIVKRPSSVKD
jgi:hypothetical protein